VVNFLWKSLDSAGSQGGGSTCPGVARVQRVLMNAMDSFAHAVCYTTVQAKRSHQFVRNLKCLWNLEQSAKSQFRLFAPATVPNVGHLGILIVWGCLNKALILWDCVHSGSQLSYMFDIPFMIHKIALADDKRPQPCHMTTAIVLYPGSSKTRPQSKMLHGTIFGYIRNAVNRPFRCEFECSKGSEVRGAGRGRAFRNPEISRLDSEMIGQTFT
jgi:hypothetical protein